MNILPNTFAILSLAALAAAVSSTASGKDRYAPSTCDGFRGVAMVTAKVLSGGSTQKGCQLELEYGAHSNVLSCEVNTAGLYSPDKVLLPKIQGECPGAGDSIIGTLKQKEDGTFDMSEMAIKKAEKCAGVGEKSKDCAEKNIPAVTTIKTRKEIAPNISGGAKNSEPSSATNLKN